MGSKIKNNEPPKRLSTPSSIGGTIFAMIFGLAFAGVGGFFTYFFLSEVVGDLDTWVRWERASCRILQSEVTRADRDTNPYELRLEYEFDTAGATHRGTEYTIKHRFGEWKGYDTYHSPNKIAARYPPGSTAECFYNPSEPAAVCLKRIVPWYGLFVFLPLIFLIIGLAFIAAPFLPEGFGEKKARNEPLSVRGAGPSVRMKRGGLLVLAVFFSIFLIVGLLMLENFLITPWLENSRAEKWTEAPCRVVSSEVLVHRGDESDSYTPDILFEFEANGKTYRSSQLNFLSSFGVDRYSEAKSIVNMLPAGSKTPCYFNPDDPNEAVIQRRFDFPLVLTIAACFFSGVGLAGLVFAIRKASTIKPDDNSSRLAAIPDRNLSTRGAPASAYAAASVVVQSTQQKRLTMILVGLFVNVFWNGIIGLFIYQTLKSGFQYWQLFPLAFLSIFLLIGILLFYVLVVHPIFSLLSPTLRVELTPGVLRDGTTIEYRWSIAGRVSRAEKLRLQLEGVEEATYTRGTDSVTDKSIFEVIDLGTVEGHALRIGSGTGSHRLPERLLPSLSTGNNRIVWYLRTRLDVKGLPDVFEENSVEVLGKEER